MKQKRALEILKTGENVFLTGSAGTGKTYLLNKYIQYLKERGVDPSIVAPTGIAASHINGTTIHSFFGIGIRENVDEYYVDILTQKEFLYKRMKKVKVLIIDEVSMVSPDLFSSIDRILRAFKNADKSFGGVQLIVSGDFFQLPPISSSGKDKRFAWQGQAWDTANLKICYLEEKFRQCNDALVDILDEIRSGSVSEKSMNVFRSCYKKELFNNFRATKLYTHNIDVDNINNKELQLLPGELKVFESRNKGSKKNIERILKSSLVTERLELKKGASVIFIKNNYEAGYRNGTLGKIIQFNKTTGAPIVEIFSGRKITVEAEDWKLEDNSGGVIAVVSQIPLKLAWALTVHKSQGMTLDAAEIDLSKTFEVGQGYVALSRIKSIDGLRLMGLNKVALKVDELILSIEEKIKKTSDLNSDKLKSFSDKEKNSIYNEFIVKNGGTVKLNEIKKNKKRLNCRIDGDYFSKKESTVDITKKLLLEKKDVKEISAERGISEDTIIKHIRQILELQNNFNISHLRPGKKTLILVISAIKEIRYKKNTNDFLENGNIKLKSIFEHLNKDISYDDIKLSLFFISK